MKTELFYNTINLVGDDLEKHQIRNASQEQRILKIFNEYGELTPAEAWRFYLQHYEDIPLTSMRRGITSLTNLGFLEKTLNRRIGIYDTLNYTWKIAE